MTGASGAHLRVLLDANVLISSLLSPSPTSSTRLILTAALAGRFTVLFTPAVGRELISKCAERPDLAARIPQAAVQELLATLGAVAEHVPPLPGPFPEVGRDRKDDYLVAHAWAAGAHYLVSWDRDLCDLGRVGGVKIVSPAEFLQILGDQGLV